MSGPVPPYAADPARIDGCDTLPKLFLLRCDEMGERTAHREKRLGIWHSHSWSEYLDGARSIGLGLASLGLRRGEAVSVLSEGRREWMYADVGIQCVGGVTTGVYTTCSAVQLAHVLQNSGSRFLLVENDEQLDKFLEIRDRVPHCETCVVLDPDGLHDFRDDRVSFLDRLCEAGRQAHREDPDRFRREVEASRPDDTALLIYTSGTTGRPKGAMITQGNVLSCVAAAQPILSTRAGDEQLCFLPLAHVLERMVSAFVPIFARSVVNFAESPETVFDNLREVSPSFFVAVPRVWEKVHARISIQAAEATGPGRRALALAVDCGRKRARFRMEGRPVPPLLEARFRFWDLLVLRNLRRMIGLDRARRVLSGAAPISPGLLEWYWSIGVVMAEGYGLTETTGILSGNLPERNRTGSVGIPVRGVEVSIGEDGEILARGPVVFPGYWKDPDETARALKDGWFGTGDAGRLDEDGYLWITGRIKDVIVTSGGKNVSPAEWENRIKFSPYIADAAVVGDGRNCLTALVMIDRECVEHYARERRVSFSDFASLCRAEPVLDLVGAEIAAVNARFSRAEQVREFRLIDRLLMPEDEELTPTMKLRREVLERTHADLIDQMYGQTRERTT